MKNILKFICFIIYTISIFFIKDYRLLILAFALNTIIALICRLSILDIIKSLKKFLPFVIFFALINWLIEDWEYAVIISIKVILCYNITYIFSKTVTVMEMANVIQSLFYPLKIFKINTKEIGIIVSISICMIPVFKKEISDLINSMKSKGKRLRVSSFIIIIKPLFISLLRRTSQLEKTIIAKGYVEQ